MTRAESPLRADRDARLVEVAGEQVELAWDPDGEVWYVRSSSVPGIFAQDPELDTLVAELPVLIRGARLP